MIEGEGEDAIAFFFNERADFEDLNLAKKFLEGSGLEAFLNGGFIGWNSVYESLGVIDDEKIKRNIVLSLDNLIYKLIYY